MCSSVIFQGRGARGVKILGWMVALMLSFLSSGWSDEGTAKDPGKAAFETHCGACHSLALPRSQHLDRANWRWVVDDMVNEFGADWLDAETQEIIIDYLVKNHGPE